MKDTYAIYKASKKLCYYLYDTRVTTKCDHAPLHKVLSAHTFNSKVNDRVPEIASMSHVTIEHIEGTANILADHISRLTSMDFYNVLEPKEGKKGIWTIHF